MDSTQTQTEDQREQNRLYARQAAVSLAHDRDAQPEEVVRRAKAYAAFILETA